MIAHNQIFVLSEIVNEFSIVALQILSKQKFSTICFWISQIN